MPSSTAIYAILNRRTDAPYIDYAIRHLRPEVDRLILVVEAEQVEAVAARYADLDIAATVAPAPTARSGAVIENPNSIDAIPSIFAAWMAGVAAARAQDGALGHLILTGSLAFGPIDATPGWLRDRVLPRVSGAWSPYPLDLSQHHHLTKGRDLPTRALHRDMIVFAPALTGDADFLAAWDALAPDADPSRDLSGCDVPLARHLAARGTPPEFDEIPDGYHSGDPGIHECHKVVRDLGLTVSRALLHLDPILHDLGAIYTRQALDTLEARNPELAAHVRRYAVRHLPSRNFNTIADQYEVLSERAASPDRGEWGFGTVALFIHAFYADMMPQFWELIDRLPCPVHLYISTATEPDRAMIEGFLRDRDWPEDRLDVRVVEVNRGRDMASLFITFRDVVLRIATRSRCACIPSARRRSPVRSGRASATTSSRTSSPRPATCPTCST